MRAYMEIVESRIVLIRQILAVSNFLTGSFIFILSTVGVDYACILKF